MVDPGCKQAGSSQYGRHPDFFEQQPRHRRKVRERRIEPRHAGRVDEDLRRDVVRYLPGGKRRRVEKRRRSNIGASRPKVREVAAKGDVVKPARKDNERQRSDQREDRPINDGAVPGEPQRNCVSAHDASAAIISRGQRARAAGIAKSNNPHHVGRRSSHMTGLFVEFPSTNCRQLRLGKTRVDRRMKVRLCRLAVHMPR